MGENKPKNRKNRKWIASYCPICRFYYPYQILKRCPLCRARMKVIIRDLDEKGRPKLYREEIELLKNSIELMKEAESVLDKVSKHLYFVRGVLRLRGHSTKEVENMKKLITKYMLNSEMVIHDLYRILNEEES